MLTRRLQDFGRRTGYGTRTFKNMGHGRQSTPNITVAWQTFLTFGFIGAAIEWKRLWGIATGVDDWQRPPPDLHPLPPADSDSNIKIRSKLIPRSE